MTKTQLAKEAAKNVVGWSSSFAIASVIRNNATPQTKVQELEVVVASFVLGAMVAEKAQEYTDRQIDSAISWWNANVKKS